MSRLTPEQLRDYTGVVVRNIIRRGLRSWLTVLGIVIGIAAVVSLISLGQGLETSIVAQFEELGSDKLFVLAKGGSGTGFDTAVILTKDDADVVEKTRGVAEMSFFTTRSARIVLDDKPRFFLVSGVPQDQGQRELSNEVINVDIEVGRNIEPGDLFKAVVGNTYITTPLLDRELKVRDKITIEDVEFKVVGALEKIGSPPDDSSIILSDRGFRALFPSLGDEVTTIIAKTDPNFDPNVVADNIQKELRNFRDVEENKEDFEVQTPEQILNTLGSVLAIVNGVLVGIAGISLLVGAVGIMNTMYTSVLERTKEIGVMKSIGARNSDITLLFLIESGLIGLIGGGIGLAGGIFFTKLVEFVIVNVGGLVFFKASFPPVLLIGALVFAFLLGAGSGTLPSIQASRLKPVDALRY